MKFGKVLVCGGDISLSESQAFLSPPPFPSVTSSLLMLSLFTFFLFPSISFSAYCPLCFLPSSPSFLPFLSLFFPSPSPLFLFSCDELGYSVFEEFPPGLHGLLF